MHLFPLSLQWFINLYSLVHIYDINCYMLYLLLILTAFAKECFIWQREAEITEWKSVELIFCPVVTVMKPANTFYWATLNTELTTKHEMHRCLLTEVTLSNWLTSKIFRDHLLLRWGRFWNIISIPVFQTHVWMKGVEVNEMPEFEHSSQCRKYRTTE